MADNIKGSNYSSSGAKSNSPKPNGVANNLAQKAGSAYLRKKGVPKGIADKAVSSALNKNKTPFGRIGGAIGGMLAGKVNGSANVDAEVPIEEQNTFGGSIKFWKILKDPMVLLTLGFLLFLGFLILGIVILVIIASGEGTGGNTSGYSSVVGGSYCTNITIKGTKITYTLEEYVARVVKAELGNAGVEGLKAQAVLARTFVLNHTSDGLCQIENGTSQQAVDMGATIDQKYSDAAKATEGLVLTYDGKITNAYFASYPNGVEGAHDWGEGGCSTVKCSGGTCTTTLYKYPSKKAWEFTMTNSDQWNGSYLDNQTGHCHGASQLGILYYESLGEDYSTIIAHFFDDGVEISKLYTVVAGDGFIRPLLDGTVTSLFGPRVNPTANASRYHKGIDLGISEGTDIYAAAPGIVSKIIKESTCGGNQLYIKHEIQGKKYTTVYMHLLSFNVAVGDTVTYDTVIGKVGGDSTNSNNGGYDTCTTGAHLHFGLLNSFGRFINPAAMVSFPGLGESFNTRY